MIEWMIRSALAGALVLLAAWLGSLAMAWLGRPRRWVWAAGLSGAAALPFLGLLLPPRAASAPGAPLSPAELATLLASTPAASAGPAPFTIPSSLILWIWLAVSAALLLAEGYALWRLERSRRGWSRGRLHGMEVLLAEHAGPAVIGLVRPSVVVPRWVVAAPERDREMVLAHERAHVLAGDPVLLAAAALLTALVPWSPALWWLRRGLRDAVETDCDARVLSAGCDIQAYGRMLLEAAGRPGLALARVALAERPNSLERRIRAMSAKLPVRPHRRVAAALVGVTLLVLAACELTPRSEKPSPTAPAAVGATAAVVPDTGSAKLRVRAVGQPTTGDSVLDAIDPAQIESVDVLKADGLVRVRMKDGRVIERHLPARRGATDPAVKFEAQRVISDSGRLHLEGTTFFKIPDGDSAAAYAGGYAAGRAAAGKRDSAGHLEGKVTVGYGTHGKISGKVGLDSIRVRSVTGGTGRPVLYLVNGQPKTGDLRSLDPATIRSIDVRKLKADVPANVPDTVKIQLK